VVSGRMRLVLGIVAAVFVLGHQRLGGSR
jgi:hypothetical protein